ncbi:MAG: ribose 5-phosphate isomerase B [Alphaproteobacteria bacterium]|nr:ribose 5-phosphate isomerase B [Alphaproteobacteria bacterium]
MVKTIAIASDHAGFELKSLLKSVILEDGYQILDLGTESTESVDYPDFGYAMADAISSNKAECGVLVCGTGIGISIAANRNPNIRAALCHDVTTARLAREHNDANVMALGARLIGTEVAKQCLTAFLETPFGGDRHAGRVRKLGAPPV